MSSRGLLLISLCSSGAAWALQLGGSTVGRSALRSAPSDDVPAAVEAPAVEAPAVEAAALESSTVVLSEAAPAPAAPAPVRRPRFEASDAWYAKALPFSARPALLAGDVAGDAGFDPVGFVNSKVDLYTYREAEIKHARLAMLAAVGWPLAELWDGPLARTLNLPSLIDANGGRDPSLLNGGLGLVNPAYWVGVVAVAAAAEFAGETRKADIKKRDREWMVTNAFVPGDLNFDPLGLYTAFGNTPAGSRKWMETAEIKNGRLAMCAVVAYVVEEFASGRAVVENTPLFFTPFYKVVADFMLTAPPLYAQ
jgi:hypothetical protein